MRIDIQTSIKGRKIRMARTRKMRIREVTRIRTRKRSTTNIENKQKQMRNRTKLLKRITRPKITRRIT